MRKRNAHLKNTHPACRMLWKSGGGGGGGGSGSGSIGEIADAQTKKYQKQIKDVKAKGMSDSDVTNALGNTWEGEARTINLKTSEIKSLHKRLETLERRGKDRINYEPYGVAHAKLKSSIAKAKSELNKAKGSLKAVNRVMKKNKIKFSSRYSYDSSYYQT